MHPKSIIFHSFYLVVFGVDACPVPQEFLYGSRLPSVGSHVQRRVAAIVLDVWRCVVLLKEESVADRTAQHMGRQPAVLILVGKDLIGSKSRTR